MKRLSHHLAMLAGIASLSSPAFGGMLGLGIVGTTANSPASTQTTKAANAKSSATTDVSDLWWNPAESGWGMQLVQNNGFVFATLFVYGVDGKPTWFTAPLNDIGGFTWTGPLYANTGPWFAGSFNPSQVGARQAGTLTFHATSIANGTVSYSVDGITVTKNITRETLVNESIAGAYDAIGTQTQSCIFPLSSGTVTGQTTLTFSQTGSSVSGQTSGLSGGCAFVGTYGQNGKLGSVVGTYSCTWGEIGNFQMFEIVVTEYGMLVRLAEQSNLCSSITGAFAGNRR